MARKREKITYKYECTMTQEVFYTTRKAPNPEELISVKAYYDLNPEEDDRPDHIKKNSAGE